MPVSTQHKDYIANKNKWQLVRDAVSGSDAIKNSRSDGQSSATGGLHNASGTRYLPAPNPDDNSLENQNRYTAYKARASFINFTGHTKDGFMGMIARKDSVIELDPSVDYALENADGAGTGLEGVAQATINELLITGRCGLLSEFPESGGGTLAATGDLQACIKTYPAESIKNWRTAIVNGRTVLTMVVLAEDVEKVAPDGFDVEHVTYHRVLFMDEGVYKQQLYDENDEIIIFEDGVDIIPRKHDGSTWSEIPFVFAGSENNDVKPDKAPLYDIAEINIAHYRNSADFEESSFLVGQPTPVISGLTQAWVKDVLESGVQLGSRSAVLLPEGASADLLQADSNSMPERGMELKEAQMIKIGAKIITDSGGIETAEAAKIRFAGQNSKLGLVVRNAEKALLRSLGWQSEFMGGTGESELDINKQFYEATVNPQLLVANMQLMDRAVIAKTDMRSQLRKAGLLDEDRTDEDIDLEVGEVDPLA
jgi:hypothetical protein